MWRRTWRDDVVPATDDDDGDLIEEQGGARIEGTIIGPKQVADVLTDLGCSAFSINRSINRGRGAWRGKLRVLRLVGWKRGKREGAVPPTLSPLAWTNGKVPSVPPA